MSDDGIRIQLKGTTFKFELLQIIGGVVEATAKTVLAVKTGGAAIAVAPNLITGLFGALKGIKLDKTLEFRAWILVSGGLLYAIEKAVNETNLNAEPQPEAFKQLMLDIGVRIQTRIYTIEPEFFSSPNKLALLDDVAEELAVWIAQFGGVDNAERMQFRLERHFSAGLHRTWMKDAAGFGTLEQSLNSPFAPSLQLMREFDGYLQYVEEEFTQARLIGQEGDGENAITLSRVFVPLRAYTVKLLESDRLADPEGDATIVASEDGKLEKRVVWLFDALNAWIAKADWRDALRIVSGGPGIGKSSSMRAFAAQLARSENVYPILIPLQKLAKTDQPLVDRIAHFLTTGKHFKGPKSPLELENHTRPVVLFVFDGLDELVRPGKDADEIAREFMVDIRRLLESENGSRSRPTVRVLAVATGRIASAASAARALKLVGDQVLHLLRFAEKGTENFFDANNLLAEDQRQTWWRLWHRVAHDVPKCLPEMLLAPDLFDVTVEPLLLYFIAVVSPWKLESTDGEFDRNKLYDQLLRSFHGRECEKGDLNFATEFDSFEDYEVVLQAMALAAWYDGSTRTGTIDLVEKLLRDWTEDVAQAFLKVIGNEKPAISAALAFYMKPGERPNSFEFLHKTFAEYLVSRRLVDAVSEIATAHRETMTQLKRKKTFNVVRHLEDWLRLTGPRPIDMDLIGFLRDEIKQRHARAPNLVNEWRDVLASCMRVILRDGIPAHNFGAFADSQLVRRPQSFKEAEEQARNAEEALLSALNATILPVLESPGFECVSIRSLPDDSSMSAFIHRLRGARGGNLVALSLFAGLDFSDENMVVQDCVGMVATRADFSRATLLFTNFLVGNLRGAVFREARLTLACFEGCRLDYADFRGASCKGATFGGASLKGANFEDANLREANLDDANAENANFTNASLVNASLVDATLDEAGIKNADLKGAKRQGPKRLGRFIPGRSDP